MRTKKTRSLAVLVALLACAAGKAGEREPPQERPWLLLEPIVAKRVVLKKDLLDGLRTYLAGRLTEAGLYRVLGADKAARAELSMRVEILKLGSQCTVLAAIRKLPSEADEDVVTARTACDEDSLVGALDVIVAKLSAADEPYLDTPREGAPGDGKPAKR